MNLFAEHFFEFVWWCCAVELVALNFGLFGVFVGTVFFMVKLLISWQLEISNITRTVALNEFGGVFSSIFFKLFSAPAHPNESSGVCMILFILEELKGTHCALTHSSDYRTP